MKLAAVIVHYNASADLERCLDSLQRHAPACDFSIVVVDNASRDAGFEAVRQRYPNVIWLLNSENTGYSRAVNQGMQAVPADYHLILNPDIEAHPGALDGVLAFAAANPRAGIIAPQLLNPDGSIQESCRRFYTFATLLLRRTWLGKVWRNSSIVDRHLMRDFDHRSSRPVDWALGGCLLARAEAVARTGPLDERFFLYFEDVDWCYRMWRAGWEVVYSPRTRFTHRHRRDSAAKTFNRTFWWHLGSLISFYEKWGMLVYLLKKWSGPLAVLLLWLLDMTALGLSFLGAYTVRRVADSFFAEQVYPFAEYLPVLGFAALLSTVTFLFSGRYEAGALWRGGGLRRLQQVGTVGLLLLATSFLGHQQAVSRVVMLVFLGFFAVTVSLGEEFVRWVRYRMERGYLALERSLFVGDAGEIDGWLRGVGRARDLGVDPVGWLCDGVDADEAVALGGGMVPWLGATDRLDEVVRRYRISQVVFWGRPPIGGEALAMLQRLREARIRLRWCIDEAWLLTAGARAESFGDAPSAVIEPATVSWLRRSLDRCAGLLLGLLLLLLAWPGWLTERSRGRVAGVEYACRGRDRMLRIARDEGGRSLPLWTQWGLGWPLVSGAVAVVGRPFRLSRGEDDRANPRQVWSPEIGRPALTGAWAAGEDSGGGFSFGAEWSIMKSALAALLLNPGGLGRVSPDREDDREQAP